MFLSSCPLKHLPGCLRQGKAVQQAYLDIHQLFGPIFDGIADGMVGFEAKVDSKARLSITCCIVALLRDLYCHPTSSCQQDHGSMSSKGSKGLCCRCLLLSKAAAGNMPEPSLARSPFPAWSDDASTHESQSIVATYAYLPCCSCACCHQKTKQTIMAYNGIILPQLA